MPAGPVAASRRVPDVDELVALGKAQGLDAVGVASAVPFTDTRHHLEDRKARGLHGGMMMTVADLVGTMGGGTLVGLRKFLPTVSMTFDFVAPAKIGDWVEGRCEVVKVTRSILFTNIYLTVGEEKILRASGIYKIPSGDGQAFTRARLDRGAEVAAKGPPA